MQELSRRHVLVTLSGASVMLCPALLNASVPTPDWGDISTDTPIGQKETFELPSGSATVDISVLQPGDVAVLARPSTSADHGNTGQTHYVAVMHRTDAQIAASADRAGTVQDPRYLVVDLTCPHRGKAVGITGNAEAPFACTDQGRRHSSIFDGSGKGVSGASNDEYLKVPAYTLDTSGGAVVLTLA